MSPAILPTRPESKELYPFLAFPSLDNSVWREQFISEIYDNLFNRGPDAGGLAYWSNILKGYQDQFNAGTITEHVFFEKVGSFILEVIAGATNSPAGQDVTSLKNKVEVAECFTDHVASRPALIIFRRTRLRSTISPTARLTRPVLPPTWICSALDASSTSMSSC